MGEGLLRIVLEAPRISADDVAERLYPHCPQGFETQEPSTLARPPVPAGRVRFVVYLEENDRATADALEAMARTLRIEHDARPVPRENWREAWKEHFQVQRIGRFVVRPSWRQETRPGPGQLVMDLDPGGAFGTGLHETTRLCLEALLELDERGSRPRRVLDFGGGTGILAIAAALLWPCTALAIDNDPVAARVCAENLRKNGVTDRVRVLGTLPAGETGFGITIANISAPALENLAPLLLRATAPGGHLVLSGLLAGDLAAIVERYEALGARRRAIGRRGDWAAPILTAPGRGERR